MALFPYFSYLLGNILIEPLATITHTNASQIMILQAEQLPVKVVLHVLCAKTEMQLTFLPPLQHLSSLETVLLSH